MFTALDKLWIGDLPEAGAGEVGEEGAEHPVIRDARRLTSASDVVEHAPVWSPDGRWIAYVTWSDSIGGSIHRAGSEGLLSLRYDGTDVRTVVKVNGPRVPGSSGAPPRRTRSSSRRTARARWAAPAGTST